MSFFFGGGGAKTKPQFTGLSTQTSTSNLPVTLVWGKNRVAPNIIWQGDFQSHKQTQKAGKGGPKIESYTYSASFDLALCWGPCVDVTHVWKDQSKETDYAALGFTLFKGLTPQAPWGYMTTAHPDQALGYSGIVHLAAANYDLGNSNNLQQHSFEVEAFRFNTGVGGTVPDADPAYIISDFLTDPSYGLGFDFNTVNQDSFWSGPDATTTGDSAFQTYCRAMGFAMSPSLIGQDEAGSTMNRWTMLCNTAIVWTGYCIKFHPYGTDELTAHGVHYLPNFPVRYAVSDKDFLYEQGADPITFDRVDPADATNSFSIIIADRANEYNDLPVPWKDQGLIDQYTLRKRDTMECKEICDADMAAIMVTLMGQREAYIRNTFNFRLPSRFMLLEPMDVLSCTDPRLGTFAVLLNEVNETDDGDFDFVAEEFHGSLTVANGTSNATMPTSNTPVNTSVKAGPVNPPIIFEPPAELAVGQVWAAVSGGDGTVNDPNWGGAIVFLSTDDITYNALPGTATSARMGNLTSALALYVGSNPDATNTLQVDLTMSAGELSDAASPTDAEAGVTVSYVGGELLSYETVNLTSPYHYDLDDLWRGQYGRPNSAHAMGAPFARLDNNIYKFDLPVAYIGQLIYIKFQSFNIFGAGFQDLADCVAYTYTPTGAGFGTGAAGAPVITTGVSGSAGANFTKLVWTANAENDGITGYQIYRAAGTGQPFSSAALIGTAPARATEYTDASVVPVTGYTYFVVPLNSIGPGPESAAVSLTTSSGGSGVTLWRVNATGTGASQNITLPYSGLDEDGVFVFGNGVRYETSEYSITGTTLTMTTNASGDSIEIIGVTS